MILITLQLKNNEKMLINVSFEAITNPETIEYIYIYIYISIVSGFSCYIYRMIFTKIMLMAIERANHS